MVAATSRLSYLDCFDLLERAMDDEVGVRVKFTTPEEAINYRMRIHKARSIDREDNKSIKRPDDPLYGRSEYDQLVCRIEHLPDGPSYLYVAKRTVYDLEIENLSEINDDAAQSPG